VDVEWAERLEDGFRYQDWMDEEMAMGSEGTVKEIVEDRGNVSDEVEVKGRDGIKGRRDSVRRDMHLEAGLKQ
jgi:hypothetical protein